MCKKYHVNGKGIVETVDGLQSTQLLEYIKTFLNSRLESEYGINEPEEEAGFWGHWSTIDHVLMLTQVIKKSSGF